MSAWPAPAGEERLSRAAHELRAPLNGIKTWAHVLESQLGESADATVRRAIAGIMTGVEEQVRLIEDLLEAKHATGDPPPPPAGSAFRSGR
jgi:signal transduction histidine kinase